MQLEEQHSETTLKVCRSLLFLLAPTYVCVYVSVYAYRCICSFISVIFITMTHQYSNIVDSNTYYQYDIVFYIFSHFYILVLYIVNKYIRDIYSIERRYLYYTYIIYKRYITKDIYYIYNIHKGYKI